MERHVAFTAANAARMAGVDARLSGLVGDRSG